MGCRPHLDPMIQAKVRLVHREYYVKWNHKLDNWEIWGRTPFGKHYMVHRINRIKGEYTPIDGRAINHLRCIKWINQSPEVYVREMRKMLANEEEGKESLKRGHENTIRAIGEDLYRPYQMLAREMGWSSGKAKIPTVQGMDFGSKTV
jgi:hypothetical protein